METITLTATDGSTYTRQVSTVEEKRALQQAGKIDPKFADNLLKTVRDRQRGKGGPKMSKTPLSTGEKEDTTQTATGQPVGQEELDTSGQTGGGGQSAQTEQSLEELRQSEEYQNLTPDEQAAVDAVFGAIVENDAETAGKLKAAFRAATKIADPYWSQQIRYAADAIERGYVNIENEEEYKEQQLQDQLSDLQENIANQNAMLALREEELGLQREQLGLKGEELAGRKKLLKSQKNLLSFELQNTLRGIERQFKQQLETTQNNLASRGFTQSTIRSRKERVMREAKGDLVESNKRKFAFQQEQLTEDIAGVERAKEELGIQAQRLGLTEEELAVRQRELDQRFAQGQRDFQQEVERLQEQVSAGKLDLLREGEKRIGTRNLPELSGAPQPLGNVVGEIPQQRQQDIIQGVQNYIF